jgi:hypothetical protein
MHKPIAFRLLVAALAVLVGSAAPAAAVAHGVDHAREAEHATAEHHHDVEGYDAGSSIEQGLHPGYEHDHPVLNPGITKRLSVDVTIVIVAHMMTAPETFMVTIRTSAASDDDVIAMAATGPPPNLRAPPAA